MNAAEQLRIAETFGISTLKEKLGKGGVVVVAPHPDDESLGCGGLIGESAASGRDTRVIFVSDGTGSHPASLSYPPKRLKNLRKSEAKHAVLELGLNPERDIVFLDLRDRFVPTAGPEAKAAVYKIVRCLHEIDASALFVTWRYDPHCDHQASFELAREAKRHLMDLRLYEYSVWGAALPKNAPVKPAIGGFRLAIERRLPQKRRAIAAHRSQTTDLIDDDPNGFRLDPSVLARFDSPYEIFFEST